MALTSVSRGFCLVWGFVIAVKCDLRMEIQFLVITSVIIEIILDNIFILIANFVVLIFCFLPSDSCTTHLQVNNDSHFARAWVWFSIGARVSVIIINIFLYYFWFWFLFKYNIVVMCHYCWLSLTNNLLSLEWNLFWFWNIYYGVWIG